MSDELSRLARLEARVGEHDRRIDALTPLLTSVVTLTVEMKNIREDLSGFIQAANDREKSFRSEFLQFIQKVDEREQSAVQDRKTNKRWFVTVVVTIICAFITVAGAIIAAGLHG